MGSTHRLINLLNESSTPYVDPLGQLRWSEVATDTWWLPPEALSLAGVPEFEALPLPVRHRLSQFEFARMLEAGVWLESIFIERFARAAGHERDPAVAARLLHEIREEAGHSLMFRELLVRSGVHVPDVARAHSSLGTFLGRVLPFSGPLFWTFTVVGEELSDRLTRTVPHAVEEATLSAVVYHMARIHVREEARHIAHTRTACEEACARSPAWVLTLLSPLVQIAVRSFARVLYYPPSALYMAAGLPADKNWRTLATCNPGRHAFVATAVRPTLEFLRHAGWRLGSEFSGRP